MKTIIFPTDFSAESTNAWEHALNISLQLNARLQLVHAGVHEPAGGPSSEQFSADWAQKQLNTLYAEATRAGVHEDRLSIRLEGDDLLSVLMQRGDHPNDLIIMGTRGDKSQHAMGSITAEVIAKTGTPVLAVPVDAKYRPIKHIAYASDFKEDKLDHLKSLLMLANELEAHLSCIHVRDSESYWSRLQVSFYEQLYYLKQMVSSMDFYVLSDVNILESISEFVDQHEVDLLSMLTHKHTLEEEIYPPSYTREMALHTHTPLLAMHAS